MSARIRLWLSGLLATLVVLAGCATPPSSDMMKAETQSYQLPRSPDRGKAMIYVLRPSSIGTFIRFNVFVDETDPSSEMGYTRGNQYIHFQVEPRTHRIYSKAENWADVLVTLKAGEVAYLQQEPSLGIVMARNTLARIDDIKGKYYVKTLTLGTILRSESLAAAKGEATPTIIDRLEGPTLATPALAPDPCPASSPAVSGAESWIPGAGERWIYNVSLGRQVKGKVAVEILDVRGRRLAERLTWLPANRMITTRDIDAGFDARRFVPPVMLPGNYQLLELAPYAEPGFKLDPGQQWSDVPAQFNRYQIGRTNVLFQVRVIGTEQVNVPAGSYEAMRIEAKTTTEGVNATLLRVTANYWYSPKVRRTVRMTLETKTEYDVLDTKESYDLVSVEPAR